MVRADEDRRRPRRGATEEARRTGLDRDRARYRAAARCPSVTRRLLASYVVLALVVLALLEVPLAVSFARNERHDLTTKVERDAVAVGSLSAAVLQPRVLDAARTRAHAD